MVFSVNFLQLTGRGMERQIFFVNGGKKLRKCLVDFENIPWTEVAKGARFKAYHDENRQVRLLEFSDGFAEEDWCYKGHVGYVVNGSFTTVYIDGEVEQYKAGDVIFIKSGEVEKHKISMQKDEKVTLLIFETI